MHHDALCAHAAGGAFGPPGARPFPLAGDSAQYARDRSFAVERTVLRVALDFDARAVRGEATLDVRRIDALARELVLDAVAFESVEVLRADGAGGLRPGAFRYDGAALCVDLADVSDGGDAQLTVRWRAVPRRGLYFLGPDAAVPDRPRQAWSQGQDQDNRHWFPCLDHPGARTKTEVFVTVPEPLFALSNGALLERTSNGDGTATYHWQLAAPHAPYLVMLAVADFEQEHDDVDGLPVSYYALRGRGSELRRSLGRTPEMIRLFARLLAQPFPWEKYAQVVVSDFIFGGMENTSATTLYERALLDERAALDVDTESLVAHELAHQWFGDLLTCREWTHAWLNEGFATYFEHVWREHAEGRDAYLYELEHDLDAWCEEDGARYRRAIVDNRWAAPIDLFDRHLYQKGGLVLHALRQHLGDDAFWRGLRAYVAQHRGRPVETRDLLRAMEDATGRSLEEFFDQWVLRPGMPSLALTSAWADGLLALTVEQRGDVFRVELPVEVVTATGTERHRIQLAAAKETFSLACATAPLSIVVDPELALPGQVENSLGTKLLVTQLASDGRAAPRWRAARALGKRNEVEAQRALSAALVGDAFWGVRAECAAALAEHRSGPALDALLAAPDDADPRVRRAVVRALGAFREARSADRLLADIARPDASWLVESERLRALGRTRDPRALDVLVAALPRASWGDVVRTAALDGLAATRDAKALPHLLPHIGYGVPPWSRRAAIAGLGTARELTTDDSLLARLREALVDQLDDFDPNVAISAVVALRELRHRSSLAALERAAQRSLDGRVRRRAREALRDLAAALAGDAAVPALRDELEKLRDETRTLRDRLAALEAREVAARAPRSAPPAERPDTKGPGAA
jgi:aminopeptidase N